MTPPGGPLEPHPAPPPAYPPYPSPGSGPGSGLGAGPGAVDPRWPRGDFRPPASTTMASWALGLAIVPCFFGITTLVGLALAITVLVRSRDGRDHGKGRAIAALVIGCAWILAGIAAALVGAIGEFTADPERDQDGAVTSVGDQSILKIRTGDCFDYPQLADAGAEADEVEATTVAARPCSQPHQFEAYLEFDLPDGDYPGVTEISNLAADRCFAAFPDFVGIAYDDSALEPYFLHPTAQSWRLLDDREVTCMMTDPGVLTSGSLKGARR